MTDISIRPDPSTTAGAEDRGDHAVVVGVDGMEFDHAAVAWATHEAEATGRPLTLVAVLGGYDVPIPQLLGPTDAERDWQALAALATEIAEEYPGIRVRHELVCGAIVACLLARSADQGMLVLGRRGLGPFARALVGSTSIATSGRSTIPVTVVPDTWRQAAHTHEPVVVGIDLDDTRQEALRYAFVEAHRRGVRLVVAHSSESYGIDRLRDTVAPYHAEFEHLTVELRQRRGRPATVLLEASAPAQLLVVGRHDSGPLGGFPLDSVTRGVLHQAEVPVLIVPGGSGDVPEPAESRTER